MTSYPYFSPSRKLRYRYIKNDITTTPTSGYLAGIVIKIKTVQKQPAEMVHDVLSLSRETISPVSS